MMHLQGVIVCYIICCSMLAVTDLEGQTSVIHDTLTLKCDQAIRIALGESYTIKSYQLDKQAMQYSFQYNQSMFKPRLDINLAAPSWEESVNPVYQANGLPVYNSYGNLQVGGEMKFTYVLPTGGNLALATSMFRGKEQTFVVLDNSNYSRNFFFNRFWLSLQQPVFTKNQLRENLREAELKYKISESYFTRAQMDIVYEVSRAFYSLFKATREVEINQEKLANAEELYRVAVLKSKGGRIAKGDEMSAEVQVAQNKALLLKSVNALETEKDQFKQLVGIDLVIPIKVSASFDFKTILIDKSRALEEALKNRPELEEGSYNIDLQQITVDRANRERDIKGSVNAYYDLTGISSVSSNSTRDLMSSALHDIGNRPPNRGIMFTISIPVADWGRGKSKMQEASYRLEQKKLALENEKISIEKEINEIIRTLNEFIIQIEIHRKNLDLAKESYKISLKRFENGDISNQELILEQERLAKIQLDYLDSFIGYQLSLNNLKRKTLWDFENFRSYTIGDMNINSLNEKTKKYHD
jgi:outer membrane protein